SYPNNQTIIPCNISVSQGDVIGVYGGRLSGSSLSMSYGQSQVATTINGQATTLYRSGMQYNLNTQQMHDIWSENAASIARVTMYINCCTQPAVPSISTPVITYCQTANAAPLVANGSNLLWYPTYTGGVGSPTAPTPSTATVGSTSDFVSQTVNGCEGPRDSIVVNVTSGGALQATTTSSPSDTVCQGQNITFTAYSSNAPVNATYQWRKNGIDIPGATNSTYVSNNFLNGDNITVYMTAPNNPCFVPNTVETPPRQLVIMPYPGA